VTALDRPHAAFDTVVLAGDTVRMIDQRVLPDVETYIHAATADEVAHAIREMVVRGAPAIGIAAAFGVAIEARRLAAAAGGDAGALALALHPALDRLAATRPTAVNLFWAIDRMRRRLAAASGDALFLADALRAEALAIWDEDLAMCRAMGDHGAALLPDGCRLLTHCNAGGLATAGYGTALGVVRSAWQRGRLRHVLADETRPFLQGARLTAWELHKDAIPVTVITDNMAAWMMKNGEVDAVVVGADRVAANGDAANKIGTYGLALAAQAHRLPFYVAFPTSTLDLSLATGDSIPIEERPAREVTHVGEKRLVPEGVTVRNPAFDVTPAGLITALITERGVVRPPYGPGLQKLLASS
jgi:methylthioribose-1-phosphate isomerase